MKITKITLLNYKFFYGDFFIDVNGENLLLYGENGSGKSSLFKALEYLTQLKYPSINRNGEKNIFAVKDDDVKIEIAFDNQQTLTIDGDVPELPEGFDFLEGLSIFRPLLDYKKLLPVHYVPFHNGDNVNLYALLREVLKNYPIGNNKVLADITEPQEYFENLKQIVNSILLTEANRYLRIFADDFAITEFVFSHEFAPDSSLRPQIRLQVNFHGRPLLTYHNFLNEARLSALAISLYFAAITKLHSTLPASGLRLLVLDDLLISLDMSNRLILLEILKSEFTDFQIFFFTHDKDLFKLYRDKMNWKRYELYLDDSGTTPSYILKKGNSLFERAKQYYAEKDYDACGMMLRKSLEETLKGVLPKEKQRDKNCKEHDLSKLITSAKEHGSDNVELTELLNKIDTDRKHILNPLSHNDSRAIYREELKLAMADIERIQELIANN